MNINLKKILPIAIIALVVAGLAVFLVVSLFFNNDDENGEGRDGALADNMDEIGFFEHNTHLDPSRISLNMGGELIQPTHAPQFIDGELYLPVDFLRAHVDRYIFWEPESDRLTISTYDEIARFTPELATYTLNWQERELSHPIRRVGNMAFMSVEMVIARYPIFFAFSAEYNILMVNFYHDQKLFYRVYVPAGENEVEYEDEPDVPRVPMRAGPSRQQPILTWLESEPYVLLLFLSNHGEFYRVRLVDGRIGYVQADYLLFADYLAAVPQIESRRPITRPGFDGPINMAWHLVTSPQAAANSNNWYVMQGVNAISPTWLYFCRPSYDGTIINFGNREFVTWAHQNGMEVWPMISDAFFSPATGPETFSNEAARFALMDAERRDFIIEQIMDMIRRYGWDGINVDYEEVREPETEHFIQFLRELSVPMRQAGAVMSVAVFVPTETNIIRWNYYEIGHAADFLTIMAYDEHWRTISWPGSVSSFPFVQNGIIDMINENVPPSQIVVGLPTYMRVWTERFNMETGEWELLPGGPGGLSLPEFYPYRRVRDVGMNFGYMIMTRDMGGTFEWDYFLRQYVSIVYHTNRDGTQLRTSAWLNCLRSTTQKVQLVNAHDLAGVAWWQKGLELPALWGTVNTIIN